MGFWVGEGGHLLGSLEELLALAVFFGALGAWFGGPKRRNRFAMAFFAMIVFGAGEFAGLEAHSRAFNECVHDSERVRQALAEHRMKTGRYPVQLDELPSSVALCERPLRGSLLHYRRTTSGYEIWFSDWLVTHSATESEPFMGHK